MYKHWVQRILGLVIVAGFSFSCKFRSKNYKAYTFTKKEAISLFDSIGVLCPLMVFIFLKVLFSF